MILTDSRLLILLSRIPKRYRWVITGGILMGVVASYFFFFFLPLRSKIILCKKELEEKKKLCALLAAKAKKKPVIKLDHITDIIQKTKLSCTHFMSLESNEYDIGFRGSFRNLLGFLKKLSRVTIKSKPLIVKKFSCCRAGRRQIDARFIIEEGVYA